MDKSKTFGFGLTGLFVGAFLAFLMRPSAFLVGQLPFEHVITRGANLKGLDTMLVPLAQQSFNIMVIGSIIGIITGLGISYFVKKRATNPG